MTYIAVHNSQCLSQIQDAEQQKHCRPQSPTSPPRIIVHPRQQSLGEGSLTANMRSVRKKLTREPTSWVFRTSRVESLYLYLLRRIDTKTMGPSSPLGVSRGSDHRPRPLPRPTGEALAERIFIGHGRFAGNSESLSNQRCW